MSSWPHGHSKTLTPADRSTRASLAANTSWGNTADRSARTQPARDALFAKFCDQVDPDGVLPKDERIRRAEYLRKAHMQRMSLAAAKARRLRAAAPKDNEAAAKDRAQVRVAEVEGVSATLAKVLATVPLNDEARERIAQLLAGGDAHEG
jgi:hypothetical protein